MEWSIITVTCGRSEVKCWPLSQILWESAGKQKPPKRIKPKSNLGGGIRSINKRLTTLRLRFAKEVVLAYPDFFKSFEIYTDASTMQLRAVITQKNRPIAFFSRKVSETQTKYSVTKIKLLAIVETLKEFQGMLWGQQIKVYTDHKNFTRDALGLTSNRVYQWRLLLEEFAPEIIYIKGIHNTVADAIS